MEPQVSENSPHYLIAIDSGGTKSQVFAWPYEIIQSPPAEDTDVRAAAIAAARSDGLNLDVISTEEATHRLTVLLQEVATQLHVPLAELSSQATLVVGMAGIDTDKDRDNATQWLEHAFDQMNLSLPYHLLSDVELGLWAATGDGVGIVLIAGTGSNCFGRNQAGETAKAGGLSHFFSDEGGGFMLGWEALHYLGKMYDGRVEKTILYQTILHELDVEDFADLKQRVVRSHDYKQVVAQVAPAVQKASEAGDSLSQTLIQKAITDLRTMVLHVHEQLAGTDPIPVFFVGGLFLDGPYKMALAEQLQAKGIAAHGMHIPDPAIGAIHFLRRTQKE